MKKMLESLREASRQAIEEAVDMDSLEALRVRYLGKKGELTAILKQMGKLSAEERPVIGQLANEVRSELENEIESRASAGGKAPRRNARRDDARQGDLSRQEARYEHRARRSR